MSRRGLLLSGLACAAAATARAMGAAASQTAAGTRWRGADVSFLPQLEAAGAVFRHSSGVPLDPLSLIRSRGVNLIRLRLWHTPTDGWCNLAHTIALAQRAKAQRLPLLLDMHFSDTWADPGQQAPPVAWSGLSGAALRSAVRAYTRDTLLSFAGAGVWPLMVQLGNEVTDGFLWPHGRISTAGWPAFAAIFNAARDGVDDAAAAAGRQRPAVLLHTDLGGDNTTARWYYTNALAFGARFDTIALSYYPWWHGTMAGCASNVADLRSRYAKDVMIVETAYPWTLAWNDAEHNPVGLASQLLAGYPATPAGQRAYLDALDACLADAGASAWCYWAPEWITAPGVGSTWENLAWFGFSGQLL